MRVSTDDQVREGFSLRLEGFCDYKGDFAHGKRTKHPTYYNDVVEPIISKELI